MSNVLEFLERVGQDWQLRHGGRTALEQAMTQAGIDAALRPALLEEDSPQLASLLQLPANISCVVHPAHEEEEEEEDDDFEDEEEDDDDEASALLRR
jgi:hypothetical protein